MTKPVSGDNEQTPALPLAKIRMAINDPSRFTRRVQITNADWESMAGWITRAITEVINEWLAGRTILELPEPDGKWADGALRWDTSARTITAGLDLADQPFIRIDGELLSIDDVEASALAELAAVREARRLASESSGDGSDA